MKREVKDFLEDIDRYIAKAEEIVQNTSAENLTEFSNESMILTLCFQIIGEAVKNLPQEIREKYPKIPWKQIAGMRDRLIHSYWSVSVHTMVETVKQNLPPLREQIQQILKDLEQ